MKCNTLQKCPSLDKMNDVRGTLMRHALKTETPKSGAQTGWCHVITRQLRRGSMNLSSSNVSFGLEADGAEESTSGWSGV